VHTQDDQDFIRSVAQLARRLAKCPRNGRGRAIPAELWKAATELAAEYGVSRVARALGLNQNSLKNRVNARGAEPQVAPTFVEWFTPFSGHNSIAECVLEVPSVHGGSVRLEMRNVAPQGLAVLVRELAG
jgi:hypothetical protein